MIMNSITTFVKKNKLLFTGLIVSIIYIILYVIFKEKINGCNIKSLMEVFYDLFLAYCASLIFYIIQVYIPMIEKEKKVRYDFLECLYDIHFYFNKSKEKVELVKSTMEVYPEKTDMLNEGNLKKLDDLFDEIEQNFRIIEIDIKKIQSINYVTKYEYITIKDRAYEQIEKYQKDKVRLYKLKQEYLSEYNIKDKNIVVYYEAKYQYYSEMIHRLGKLLYYYPIKDIEAVIFK